MKLEWTVCQQISIRGKLVVRKEKEFGATLKISLGSDIDKHLHLAPINAFLTMVYRMGKTVSIIRQRQDIAAACPTPDNFSTFKIISCIHTVNLTPLLGSLLIRMDDLRLETETILQFYEIFAPLTDQEGHDNDKEQTDRGHYDRYHAEHSRLLLSLSQIVVSFQVISLEHNTFLI